MTISPAIVTVPVNVTSPNNPRVSPLAIVAVAATVELCLTPTAPVSIAKPAESNVAILVPAMSTSISSAVVAPISIFVFPSASAIFVPPPISGQKN